MQIKAHIQITLVSFLISMVIGSCSIRKKETDSRYCYLRKDLINKSSKTLREIISDYKNGHVFLNDSSNYCIAIPDFDSLFIYKLNGNEESIKSQLSYLESHTGGWYTQNRSEDLTIFTNTLPNCLFLKKNGKLTFVYLGIGRCDSHMIEKDKRIVSEVYSLINLLTKNTRKALY